MARMLEKTVRVAECRPRGLATRAVGGLLALGWIAAVWASEMPPEPVGPQTYTSPSGAVTLRVDPSDRYGAGKATYELRRDGGVVWSLDHPATLVNVAVQDDGTVIGYAYSHGVEGKTFSEAGDFVVARIRADGSLQVLDRVRRESSRFLHTDPDPKAAGSFVDADDDRFVVRVLTPDLNAPGESWWIYRLSNGERVGRIKPGALLPVPDAVSHVVDARPVAGTPLTLVHWLGRGDHTGALFAVVDLDGQPVWTLDLPEDYGATDEEFIENSNEVSEGGAILDMQVSHRFAVRHWRENLRVTYEVQADAGEPTGWRVREAGRSAFVATAAVAEPANETVPQATLRLLGTIRLGGDSAEPSPIRDLREFDVDDRGRFGFLTSHGCSASPVVALTVVDGEGELLRRVDLPRVRGGCNLSGHVASVSGGRWIVTVGWDEDAKPVSRAFAVDVDAGVATPLEKFEAPRVDAIDSFPNGEFVALTSEHRGYTITDSLVAYDAQGKKLWEVASPGSSNEHLFSPEDVAVVTTGEVVVLENVSNELEVYGADGVHRATVDLASAWGREPNYPSQLGVDRDGGVIVHDFNGKPSVVRMSSEGKVIDAFSPALADGRAFNLSDDVRSDVDGRLWTTDGHSLLRLGADGKVDRILGTAPTADSLQKVAALALGPGRQIYAADQRTGAVHVFDSAGTKLQVCRPSPDDFDGDLVLASLTVADAGDVYLSNGYSRGADPFVHFSPTCERVGRVGLRLDSISQEWYAQRGASNLWVLGYNKAFLVDAGGSALRTLDRTRTRAWLSDPGPASVAADGSIAIVSGERMPVQEQRLVTLFNASGDAIMTAPLPRNAPVWTGDVAYDGARIAFLVSTTGDENTLQGVVVTNAQGQPQFQFTPQPERFIERIFLVTGDEGPELWTFTDATIDRYAIP